MKIAILTPWSISPNAVGGTERFVMDLANSFVNLGNSVDVYMLSGKEYTQNDVRYFNMNLFGDNSPIDEYFLRNVFGDFSTEKSYDDLAEKMEQLIDLNDYDLIQLNSQLFLKAFKNNKRIFTIHTNPFEYELDWGKESFDVMTKIMNKEASNSDTIFVAPSMHYSNEYSKITGISIKYIPHAIEIGRILTNKSKETICDTLNLDYQKEIILLPSRLEPIQKQPMLFMEAFARFDKSIKEKYLVVCTGVDKQYVQYAREIKKFCLKNNITINMLRFDSMADAYKVASLIILPSQSESFGYSALESLSLGIPTILNNIPTYAEIVKGSKNSYLFNLTVDDLYEKLKIVFSKVNYRVKQDDIWQSQYDVQLFAIRYLNLLIY